MRNLTCMKWTAAKSHKGDEGNMGNNLPVGTGPSIGKENGTAFFLHSFAGAISIKKKLKRMDGTRAGRKSNQKRKGQNNMAFFGSAITILRTLVVAIGAGLAVWGVINLLEGYGNDNPGANAQVS